MTEPDAIIFYSSSQEGGSSHPENQGYRKGGELVANVPCGVRVSMSEEAQATEGN
jgi:hypothetical protein